MLLSVCVWLPALYNKTVKLHSCLVLCVSEGSEPRENIKAAVTTIVPETRRLKERELVETRAPVVSMIMDDCKCQMPYQM